MRELPGVGFATNQAGTSNSQPGKDGRGRPRRRCPRDIIPLPVVALGGPDVQLDAKGTGRKVCRTVTLDDLWCGSADGAAFEHEQERVLLSRKFTAARWRV